MNTILKIYLQPTIRQLIIIMPPKTKKAEGPAPTQAPYVPTSLSEFQDALCSWKKPLEKYVNGPVFQKIHKFIEDEYKSKVVQKWLFRFILLKRIFLMPLS